MGREGGERGERGGREGGERGERGGSRVSLVSGDTHSRSFVPVQSRHAC